MTDMEKFKALMDSFNQTYEVENYKNIKNGDQEVILVITLTIQNDRSDFYPEFHFSNDGKYIKTVGFDR